MLPEPSVIVHVTFVKPNGNTAPARSFVPLKSFNTEAVEQLSPVDVGLNSLPVTV
ncbi:hypothetical protein ES705_38452 [subsurface metagenome]